MSIELITILMFGSMLVVLLTGLPIAFVLGGLGVLFAAWLWGSTSLIMVSFTAFAVQNWSSLICIPMFLLMGVVLERAGIAEDLFRMIYLWIGKLRGGLAAGVIIICMIFAAMVGISGAATVAMGLIALPIMLMYGYDKEISMGSIQAGGALGILIPPSVCFAVFGVVAQESIARLFAAGLFPGILLGILFITYILVRCRFQPHLGPPPPVEEKFSRREKLISLKSLILPFLLVAAVLGMIFSGITTPMEASGVGAVGSVLAAIVHRRFSWQLLNDALEQTLKISSMLGWIIIGALVFSRVYDGLGAGDVIRSLITGSGFGPWGVLIVMQLSFFVMGCFMDDGAILFICAPVYIPIVRSLGFDMIWYGVLFIMNTEMAFLTPPYGINLFYLKGVVPKGITIGDIYKSVWPFVTLQAIGLAIVMIFPQIALWLPNLIYGVR